MSKKTIITLGLTIAASITLATLVKCSDEKAPEINYGLISYSMDWGKLLAGYTAPKTLHYCFYPSGNGAMIQVEGEARGLTFTLPPDKYKLLIVNSDAANIAFRNMDTFDKAEAFLSQAPETKAEVSSSSDNIPLYGFVVKELEIAPGDNNRISFSPTPLVREVSLDVKIDGMGYVSYCKGKLTGVPSGLNLSQQKIVSEATSTVEFDTTPTAEGIKANVMILGTLPQKGEEPPAILTSNEMTLDFTLTDGSTVSSTIDLGSQLNETEGEHVHVDAEAAVEKKITFSVRINRWEVSTGDSMVIE